MTPVQRINDSFLGPLERPALAWMAARLPAAIVPDHLTAFGVMGGLITAAGFLLSRGSPGWLWLASAGLLINWFGDSLDGTLARVRRIERPRYGFFIDHTSDLFCQSLTFIALGLSPLAHFGMACLGLITFLMAFVYTLIAAQTRATMRITYFYFGPTEIRALLLLGNLLTLAFGVVDLRRWFAGFPGVGPISIHDAVITMLSASGIVVIALLAWRDARVLNVEDPPRQ
ncbi:MAG TPA: CDP-alcohol phosphatidyltransferase family protein [Steroidobacteraceae bacterium]|nr:CDP-alcohol phosphatidyltransferase family protein [Steroidobacteraceae bacterium]